MQPDGQFHIIDARTGHSFGHWQASTADEALDALCFSLGFDDRAGYLARHNGDDPSNMVATPVDPRALRHERAYMRSLMDDDGRPFASEQIGPIVRDAYIAASRLMSGGPVCVEAMAIGPQDDDAPADGPMPAAHRAATLDADASADEIIDTALRLIDEAADAAAAGVK